ncbi:MAG: hypothetical protein QOD88_3274 [Mycobacterium sp.]|jgi:hypothetical protein|nr:hypothetical protein [Mycobacterium sp.]MDT5230028.1 hypothetical protein [Mycobacterium sp.]MDT5320752.1 hypothetical protein [Mycobacterium sp.]
MIAKRRAKVDDRNRELLPDSPESDPREVLDYLRRCSGPDIPAWVLQAEIADALTLNNWLWWEDRRRELYFLKAGRDRGIFLAQLGSQVGVKKQGVIDRIDRLEALLRFDRPDEKITRETRRSAREARLRRPVEEAWLQARRDELIGLIAEMVGQADRYEIDDDEREWVDQLAMDARDEELAPATMIILGLAAAELRAAPGVLALRSVRPCAVHAVLAHADCLRTQFAALGTATPASARRRSA